MDKPMPRFFFDLHDHESETDNLGTELGSERAAWIAAVQFAGEVLKNEPTILESEGLMIDARDEKDNVIFTVEVKLVDHR